MIDLSGEIVEVGRNANGENEVVIRVNDHCVTVAGISDALVKLAARAIYEDVRLQVIKVNV